MDKLFRGTGVALVTPFNENGDVDYKALEQITDNQIRGGTDYLVALGTTAETATLTGKEKNEIVNFIKERSSGLPVVVGMGGNDTKKIIKQIDKFDFEEVSGVLIVTPYYNKPSQEGMFRHYSAIAKACPVPIILYNVPSRTGINLEAETVGSLAEKNENIVAVKEASGIFSQMTKIIKYTPDNFSLISGDDVLCLPIISIGGKGVISVVANALPEKISNLVHLALEGRFESAQMIHLELIE
ncbi:MAG: 4-hydroxy-tetrahydrodipicolinate synthase, partial [Prolixibacteraceae bacterium]|nr:4-hydroxy-tetrahydrodipicolinate synthase [Prolixibacteraceae bacterium]